MRKVMWFCLLLMTAVGLAACNGKGSSSFRRRNKDADNPGNVMSLVHVTSDERTCIFKTLGKPGNLEFSWVDLNSGEVAPFKLGGAWNIAGRGPVTFSPDARCVAFGLTGESEPPYPVIVVSAREGRRTVCQTPVSPFGLSLPFAPDGRSIAMLGWTGVQLLRLSDSNVRTLVDFERDFGNGIYPLTIGINSHDTNAPGIQSWTPDRRRIFFLAGKWFDPPDYPKSGPVPRYILHSVDIESGNVTNHKIMNASVLAFVDENSLLAQIPTFGNHVGEGDCARIVLVDLTDGTTQPVFELTGGDESFEYLLPWYYLGRDGKFAYAYEGDVYLYDLKTDKVSQLTSDGRNGAAVYLLRRDRILFAARRLVYMVIGDEPSYVYRNIRLMKPDGSDSKAIYWP